MVSTIGMFGFEAREFIKRRTKLLAEKWEKPYSFVRAVVRSFTNARMSIALVRVMYRWIGGSRTPVSNTRLGGGTAHGLLKSDN